MDIDDLDFSPSTKALLALLKLSTVLDTINHDIPLKCLVGKASLQGPVLKWLTSYLNFEFQVVIALHLLPPILSGTPPSFSFRSPFILTLSCLLCLTVVITGTLVTHCIKSKCRFLIFILTESCLSWHKASFNAF